MKLSVCVITYNHEKYIAQCIESILFQIVDFEFEIVIGVDKSTDRTLQICRNYQLKHPNLIRIIEHNENIGMINNWLDTINKSIGHFIAICEGDDYWNDSYKLNKQISFLNNNPKYVGCFHNTEERFEELTKASILYCDFPHAKAISYKEICSFNPIPTCSVVFVRNYLGDLPDWYSTLPIADWPLHLINSQYGDFWYIPEVMGVHRHSFSSTWSLRSKEKNSRVVVEVYDIMINGFHNNIKIRNLLIKSRKNFKLRNKFPIINYFEYLYLKLLKKVNSVSNN